MPQVYPDSVLQVILNAYQHIRPSATLADINQAEFGGTYFAFYQTANKTQSLSHTGFIDLMRGVSNNNRADKRAKQQEHYSTSDGGGHTTTEPCKQ